MAEIGRRFDYDENRKPCMILYKKSDPDGRSFGIRQADAWKFSEDHNETFVSYVTDLCQQAYAHLGFRMTVSQTIYKQRLVELANVIEGGLDELIEMPPKPKVSEDDMIVAQGMMQIGDQRQEVAITKGMIHGGV